jgi:ankyrin repeat protein
LIIKAISSVQHLIAEAFPSSCSLSIDDEEMNSIDQELYLAARENNVPEVSRLLSVGADVNAKNNYGETPLHWACGRGHVQVVIELREHGADIEAKDYEDWTPLHWACCTDNLAAVTELLSPNDSNGATSRGANIEAKDSNDWTPLHWVCSWGYSAVVKELRDHGANMDAKNTFGETPLHLAATSDRLAVVKALVSGGASMLAVDNHGQTPVQRAVTTRRSEVAKYLLQHAYATTRRLPLHQLLKDITWIDIPNSIDVPPIRYAFERNVLDVDDVVEILEYLVGQNPALLSSRNQNGALPLHVACRRGAAFPTVQSLVNMYKASVKSLTSEGDLPLFLACEMPNTSLDTIFLLMKLYPDLVYR